MNTDLTGMPVNSYLPVSNMDVIYLIYGLAFVVLGLAIVLRHQSRSQLELARIIWLLAAFGFLHGLLEWSYFWSVTREVDPWFVNAQHILLPISYLPLFEFGRQLLLVGLTHPSSGSPVSRMLSRWIYVPVLLALLAASTFSVSPMTALNIWSRYLLGFPASLISGVALYIYCNKRLLGYFDPDNHTRIRILSYVASIGFIAYAVLGGLIIPPSDGLFDTVLNSEIFFQTLHVPVQLVRALCAVLIAVSFSMLLKVFQLETLSQLVQSEKMASLGALVAGVSHEINTPLGISVTCATTLQEEFMAVSRHYEAGTMTRSTMEQFILNGKMGCDMLVSNLFRAANLVRSFKKVAVDQSSDEWRQLNLSEYIDEIILSLKPRLKGMRIQVVNDSARDIVLYTHPGSIYQLISNLVINALIHAYEPEQAGVIRIDAKKLGKDVEIDVSDDGKGIPADIQGRIFDPFFTTRRGSGGSGLGLNIVFNLVSKSLGGNIQLVKGQFAGSMFRIRFPVRHAKLMS